MRGSNAEGNWGEVTSIEGFSMILLLFFAPFRQLDTPSWHTSSAC